MSDLDVRTYNGWRNRETWLVNVWLSNDEISYNYFRSILKQGDSRSSAKDISGYFEELLEDSSISLWSDLLREALSKVDWLEIASHQ